jgi:hypothetical protein
MTGAVGTARYSISVLDDSGAHMEYIDIDWDNPYFGFNSANASATNDFSGTPSTDLKVSHFIQSGSVPNAAKVGDLDFEAWLDTLLFPPYILANAVSYNDANAFYGVRYQPLPVPQFADGVDAVDPTTLPRKLNKDAIPAQWQGDWQGGGVYVTLMSVGGEDMFASVTDRTANPMIQFTDKFTLGEISWVGKHLIHAAITRDLGTNSPVSKVFRLASAAALDSVESPHKVFNKTATKLAKKTSVRLDATSLSKAGASIAAFAGVSRSTAYLINDISLTLYDVFSGGAKQGQLLNYRRCDGDGKTLADVLLVFIPILH